VVPLYYDRGPMGFSPEWIHMAKRSISTLLPRFNSYRMVGEYLNRFYGPASGRGRKFFEGNYAAARGLAEWKKRIRSAWPYVQLRAIELPGRNSGFGDPVKFEVAMKLYPRVDIDQAGIAALTSMYYFDANDRVGIDDYRPAVHDSDGLLIWSGRGEQIWRPLGMVSAVDYLERVLGYKPHTARERVPPGLRAVPGHQPTAVGPVTGCLGPRFGAR